MKFNTFIPIFELLEDQIYLEREHYGEGFTDEEEIEQLKTLHTYIPRFVTRDKWTIYTIRTLIGVIADQERRIVQLEELTGIKSNLKEE